MTYDPFQTYATLGAYSGIGNPFQTPFNAIQTSSINPVTPWNPLGAYQFQPGYNAMPFNPQTQYWQNPLLPAGLQHGGSHHHLLQQLAAHQLAQQMIAQQLAAQQIAAQQSILGQPFGGQQFGSQPLNPYQQTGFYPQVGQIGFAGYGMSPFGQPGSPFNQIGSPLPPQSWVGQAGQLGAAQTNPVLLAQLTARALQAQGIAPGVGLQG